MPNPLVEGRVVYVPTWTCPKCGAVCNVEFIPPLSAVEKERVALYHEYTKTDPKVRKTRPEFDTFENPYDRTYLLSFRQHVPESGLLKLTCTRCGHVYTEKPLDA